MKKIALPGAFLALQLFMFAAAAQQTQTEGAQQSGAQDTVESSDEGESSEPVSDDAFIPSEEVQAAEELTFPVNI